MILHGLDTEKEVFFYEQEFYVLSNFSSFNLRYLGVTYQTSEHAYQCQKFTNSVYNWSVVYNAPSAHEAFINARSLEEFVKPNWREDRVRVMKSILFQKVFQHPYVKKKLLETGDRILVENSWRDSFWGIGLNKDGQNMLGKLWMEIRQEIFDNY